MIDVGVILRIDQRIVSMTILVFDGPVSQFRLLASALMVNSFTDGQSLFTRQAKKWTIVASA